MKNFEFTEENLKTLVEEIFLNLFDRKEKGNILQSEERKEYQYLLDRIELLGERGYSIPALLSIIVHGSGKKSLYDVMLDKFQLENKFVCDVIGITQVEKLVYDYLKVLSFSEIKKKMGWTTNKNELSAIHSDEILNRDLFLNFLEERVSKIDAAFDDKFRFCPKCEEVLL